MPTTCDRRPSALVLLLLTLLVGCRAAGRPPMSLEEAKNVTMSVTGAPFVAPPRTIKDLERDLAPADVSYTSYTWPKIEESSYSRERAAALYAKRGLDERRVGQF